MKYIASNIDDKLKSDLEGKLQLPAVQPVDQYTMKADPNGRIHLPGSGSARAYMKSFAAVMKESVETKMLCLVLFCSEGDNRQHAFKFADKVANLLNRDETVLNLPKAKVTNGAFPTQGEFDWSVPFSWRSLFGEEPPSEIF